MSKTHKKIAALLEPHGLTLVDAGKHIKVMKGNATLDTLSTSPKDPNSHKNTIRRLSLAGHVPMALREVKF